MKEEKKANMKIKSQVVKKVHRTVKIETRWELSSEDIEELVIKALDIPPGAEIIWDTKEYTANMVIRHETTEKEEEQDG